MKVIQLTDLVDDDETVTVEGKSTTGRRRRRRRRRHWKQLEMNQKNAPKLMPDLKRDGSKFLIMKVRPCVLIWTVEIVRKEWNGKKISDFLERKKSFRNAVFV